MHTVYKYVYNTEIIYIGKCDGSLSKRLSQHGKKGDNIPEDGHFEINNSDIYFIELPNRVMTDVVESELIRRYKPKYNKAKMSEWQGIPFAEPQWKAYRVCGKRVNGKLLDINRSREKKQIEKRRIEESEKWKQLEEELKQSRIKREEDDKKIEEVIRKSEEVIRKWDKFYNREDIKAKIQEGEKWLGLSQEKLLSFLPEFRV